MPATPLLKNSAELVTGVGTQTSDPAGWVGLINHGGANVSPSSSMNWRCRRRSGQAMLPTTLDSSDALECGGMGEATRWPRLHLGHVTVEPAGDTTSDLGGSDGRERNDPDPGHQRLHR